MDLFSAKDFRNTVVMNKRHNWHFILQKKLKYGAHIKALFIFLCPSSLPLSSFKLPPV